MNTHALSRSDPPWPGEDGSTDVVYEEGADEWAESRGATRGIVMNRLQKAN